MALFSFGKKNREQENAPEQAVNRPQSDASEQPAEETQDKGLRQMFAQLSGDEYRHAEQLRGLIEKTL